MIMTIHSPHSFMFGKLFLNSKQLMTVGIQREGEGVIFDD